MYLKHKVKVLYVENFPFTIMYYIIALLLLIH